MTRHEWRDRTAEGVTYLYRANVHSGEWRFYRKEKRDPEWTALENISREELEIFREVLWNKHLRRRAPEKHVFQIDALLAEMDEEE